MAFTITENARIKAKRNNKTPNLVFEIDGVSTKYGLVVIKKYILIGDPDLEIGPDWVIGGYNNITDQLTAITFDGTTTSINQKLDPDKSAGSSISTMAMALLDIDGSIADLLSPGFTVADILGRKATVSLGFGETAFPQDYIKIFRGIIDQVSYGPQKTIFQLSHPDQKKRQDIFVKADTVLDGSITNADTTITVDSTLNFLTRILGPDGNYDSSVSYGLRIDDEIIFYTGKSGTTFTGCTRGALGTTASSHSDDAQVDSFYRLEGNGIDLALKLMLSGWAGPYVENIDVKHIGQLGDLSYLDNAIYFENVDIYDLYGVIAGDWVTISGATNGGNNVTRQITEVTTDGVGSSYLILDGAILIAESDSPAVIEIRSKYDTLAAGLKLSGDEVDVKEHLRIQRLFLSTYDLDFYLKDTINGKEFIEGEIYFPGAAYSIPRKSQVSIGYHTGPIPGANPKIFTNENTKKASTIQINRNINRNFYNTIIYKFEELPLEDKFIRGHIEQDATSLAEIPIGTKALIIKSKGMRELLGGQSISATAASKRLKRYKRGAEYINSFEVLYGDSYNVEIGDIVVVEGDTLQMLDVVTASRQGLPKLYEIINKTFDIKTGGVKLDLINTNYSANTRYCLMSPTSRVESATSTTVFKIRKTGNSPFGNQEGLKWSRYLTGGGIVNVRVCSDDFTTRNDVSTIQSISGNTVTLSSALSFTPLAEDKLLLVDYDNVNNETLKLIYGWMTNNITFADGTKPYEMIG